MTEAEFRDRLRANGYLDTRTIDYAPHHGPEIHTHEFSAMGIVTAGELTLVYEDRRETFAVGEWYEVPAGTPHAEHTGEAATSALLGTKSG
jgi:quercetin dioxygenase-like cupin family protein